MKIERDKVRFLSGLRFGETIGSTLSDGIKLLLGFDTSEMMSDGQMLGAAFAEGFKSGFDGAGVMEPYGQAFAHRPHWVQRPGVTTVSP